MPLAVSAAPGNLQTESDNPTVATTSVTDSAADGTAFVANATGTGIGYGVEGTSAGGAGAAGWSVSPPGPGWFLPEYTKYSGGFGSAPASLEPDSYIASAVWGDSPDIGVYGSGGNGVVGYGGVGVEGDANSISGSVGVWAWAR